MDGLVSEIGLTLLATLAGGFLIGWVIRSAVSRSRINQLNDNWQAQLDDVARQRDRLTAETDTLRMSIEAQEAVIHQRDMAVTKIRTELDSALEKEKLLTKNVFTLRAEREDFKTKMIRFQNSMAALQRQSSELQSEFIKSGEFYKGELTKAFERRKLLEEKIDNSKAEYESFSNLLQASRSEHESVNKMLAAAKTRLDNLDALERSVIELEAENAQLKHDSAITRQENDALNRDVFEQEELKIQNKELAEVLKSMENSRKQYEDDANRYRQHAGKSEQKSETLRIRLDEVEKNFLEIEKQQDKALKAARKSATEQKKNSKKAAKQEEDDLKEIIGIGKVFEHTLHELGVFSFRQIANFDISDIARLNSELKEFKGRMEQDDWIGQAKDLLFKKYGNV
jgi:predicted flap endonuclease-1-like 5' DNA nuclease/predicted  nucleic acid-binding Zn-ribbon protein